MANAVLDAARAKRAKAQDKIDELLKTPTDESRALTEDESDKFEKYAKDIKDLDKQIRELEKHDERTAKAERAKVQTPEPADESRGTLAPGEAVIGYEPGTYRQDAIYRNEASYLRDLAAVQIPQFNGENREAALARLNQNWKEIQRDARQGANKALARRMVDEEERYATATGRRSVNTIWENSSDELRTNPNTTAGTGGEFVPPLWLVSQYVPYDRPGRIAANRVTNQPLPPGIDVINIPKITNTNNSQLVTTTQTAIQTANAAAVQSTDITTTSVTSTVRTIAGQQDISLQLMEQSPLAMDGVVFDELTRDYDMQLDYQVLAGSNGSGQHKGVFSLTQEAKTIYTTNDVTKASTVTCTSATFDGSQAAGQLRSVLAGINFVESLAFVPPTAIWVHPRRANSWLFQADGNKRPLINPAAYGPYSAVGTGQPTVAQGVAFELLGLPVIKDAVIPTTFNTTAVTGGTADGIAVLKEDDIILWEGTMRMRALPEILSGTLQIRFQVYCYSAFIADRRPVGVALVSGNTGLAAPSF